MVGSCFPLCLVSQLGVAENIQVGVSSDFLEELSYFPEQDQCEK